MGKELGAVEIPEKTFREMRQDARRQEGQKQILPLAHAGAIARPTRGLKRIRDARRGPWTVSYSCRDKLANDDSCGASHSGRNQWRLDELKPAARRDTQTARAGRNGNGQPVTRNRAGLGSAPHRKSRNASASPSSVAAFPRGCRWGSSSSSTSTAAACGTRSACRATSRCRRSRGWRSRRSRSITMTPRARRRLRRRRVLAAQRHRAGLRDLLRRRAERAERDRRGVRGEVAGRRRQRRAGPEGPREGPAAAPQGQDVRDAAAGVRRGDGRQRRAAGRAAGGGGDRARASRRACGTSGRSTSRCRTTWSTGRSRPSDLPPDAPQPASDPQTLSVGAGRDARRMLARREEAGHPRRRRAAPVRADGRRGPAGRAAQHPDRRRPAQQVRGPGEPPALPRRLRRGDVAATGTCASTSSPPTAC